ncbi:MAG: glycosyltransferase [Sedimenticola sp.]
MYRPTNIFFAHYGDEWIRGSERCLLDLLKHIDRTRFHPTLWCNSETMGDAVRKLNIAAEVRPMPILFGWQAPRFDFTAYAKLIRHSVQTIRKQEIDLIHANSGAPVQWLNPAARITRTPLLAHLHARYPLRDRLTLGLHQVSLAVGVSPPVIEQLHQDGMPESRTRVIPNAIDIDHHNAQPPVDLRSLLNLKPNDFVMITVGSLIQRKGVDLMIHGVRQLINQGIPLHLAVIGDGPEQSALQQQIDNFGLQQHIHLLGERDDVPSLLRGGADLFLSAAREEVFGLVLAEAALARLPVIAPSVGGIPGVVTDGITGKLFKPENIKAMNSAITTLYHSSDLRRKMGRSGRQQVAERFNVRRYCHTFEQTYQTLLASPAHRMNWHHHWPTGPALSRALGILIKQ